MSDQAKLLAKKALGIEWHETESGARMIAKNAADRIEELEAELRDLTADLYAIHEQMLIWKMRAKKAEDKLAKTVQALKGVRDFVKELGPPSQGEHLHPSLYDACMILKDLEKTDE